MSKNNIPDGAKKPTDRERAKAEAEAKVIRFQWRDQDFEIDPAVINDVELIEDLGDLESQPLLLPRVTRRMIGAEQWKRFKDTARVGDAVPADALEEFFTIADEALGNL